MKHLTIVILLFFLLNGTASYWRRILLPRFRFVRRPYPFYQISRQDQSTSVIRNNRRPVFQEEDEEDSESFVGKIPQVPPPSGEGNNAADGSDEDELPPFPPPFGFYASVLVLIPEFNLKLQKLPEWLETEVTFSIPMTIIFENIVPPKGYPPYPFTWPWFGPPKFGHFVGRRSLDDSLLRRKKEPVKLQKPSMPLNASYYEADRAVFVPKLQTLLEAFGFGSKDCFLRAICEIHHFPLSSNYGFFGQLIQTLFRMSRSPFADEHLQEYLLAEKAGNEEDCQRYSEFCQNSIFY